MNRDFDAIWLFMPEPDSNPEQCQKWINNFHKEIEQALKIAKRINEEPSSQMVVRGIEAWYATETPIDKPVKMLYKTMMSQLIQEIKDEQG